MEKDKHTVPTKIQIGNQGEGRHGLGMKKVKKLPQVGAELMLILYSEDGMDRTRKR